MTTMEPPPSPSIVRARLLRKIPLAVLSILILVVICMVVFPNDFKLQKVFRSSCSKGAAAASTTSDKLANVVKQPADDLRVFLGVLTRPDMYKRRALLQLAYTLQPWPARAVIDVCFVFCNLDKEEDRMLVVLEIIVYGDVVVLNCTENMDGGKTYDYFSAIPRIFADETYDYVGKTDDDTHYCLAALADTVMRWWGPLSV